MSQSNTSFIVSKIRAFRNALRDDGVGYGDYKSGDELETQYSKLLRELRTEKGMLGQIFTKSQNKIQGPAKLYKLIALINAEQWVLMSVKDKGDIYERLLEKNAEDIKSSAGHYFTLRALIKTMVEGIRPEAQYLANEQRQILKYNTFYGKL